MIRKLFLLAAVSGQALAESHPKAPAQGASEIAPNEFVQTVPRGLKLSGYVDTGYSYNFTGGGGGTSDVSGRFGSDTAAGGDFNLYAVKLTLEKALTEENRAQAGFRADVMIGEDAAFLANRNAVNNTRNYLQNSSALFLEQAYVSFRVPLGNGWDFQVGKFVSMLGFEVIERPANLNITYGLLWEQMPLYYTGVLSSYRLDEFLDAQLGVVNGSNTDNNTTTGLDGDGCAVLASLNVTAPGGNATWSHNFQYSSNAESKFLPPLFPSPYPLLFLLRSDPAILPPFLSASQTPRSHRSFSPGAPRRLSSLPPPSPLDRPPGSRRRSPHPTGATAKPSRHPCPAECGTPRPSTNSCRSTRPADPFPPPSAGIESRSACSRHKAPPAPASRSPPPAPTATARWAYFPPAPFPALCLWKNSRNSSRHSSALTPPLTSN